MDDHEPTPQRCAHDDDELQADLAARHPQPKPRQSIVVQVPIPDAGEMELPAENPLFAGIGFGEQPDELGGIGPSTDKVSRNKPIVLNAVDQKRLENKKLLEILRARGDPVPSRFLDVVTGELMIDPVINKDGNTMDRRSAAAVAERMYAVLVRAMGEQTKSLFPGESSMFREEIPPFTPPRLETNIPLMKQIGAWKGRLMQDLTIKKLMEQLDEPIGNKGAKRTTRTPSPAAASDSTDEKKPAVKKEGEGQGEGEETVPDIVVTAQNISTTGLRQRLAKVWSTFSKRPMLTAPEGTQAHEALVETRSKYAKKRRQEALTAITVPKTATTTPRHTPHKPRADQHHATTGSGGGGGGDEQQKDGGSSAGGEGAMEAPPEPDVDFSSLLPTKEDVIRHQRLMKMVAQLVKSEEAARRQLHVACFRQMYAVEKEIDVKCKEEMAKEAMRSAERRWAQHEETMRQRRRETKKAGEQPPAAPTRPTAVRSSHLRRRTSLFAQSHDLSSSSHQKLSPTQDSVTPLVSSLDAPARPAAGTTPLFASLPLGISPKDLSFSAEGAKASSEEEGGPVGATARRMSQTASKRRRHTLAAETGSLQQSQTRRRGSIWQGAAGGIKSQPPGGTPPSSSSKQPATPAGGGGGVLSVSSPQTTTVTTAGRRQSISPMMPSSSATRRSSLTWSASGGPFLPKRRNTEFFGGPKQVTVPMALSSSTGGAGRKHLEEGTAGKGLNLPPESKSVSTPIASALMTPPSSAQSTSLKGSSSVDELSQLAFPSSKAKGKGVMFATDATTEPARRHHDDANGEGRQGSNSRSLSPGVFISIRSPTAEGGHEQEVKGKQVERKGEEAKEKVDATIPPRPSTPTHEGEQQEQGDQRAEPPLMSEEDLRQLQLAMHSAAFFPTASSSPDTSSGGPFPLPPTTSVSGSKTQESPLRLGTPKTMGPPSSRSTSSARDREEVPSFPTHLHHDELDGDDVSGGDSRSGHGEDSHLAFPAFMRHGQVLGASHASREESLLMSSASSGTELRRGILVDARASVGSMFDSIRTGYSDPALFVALEAAAMMTDPDYHPSSCSVRSIELPSLSAASSVSSAAALPQFALETHRTPPPDEELSYLQHPLPHERRATAEPVSVSRAQPPPSAIAAGPPMTVTVGVRPGDEGEADSVSAASPHSKTATEPETPNASIRTPLTATVSEESASVAALAGAGGVQRPATATAPTESSEEHIESTGKESSLRPTLSQYAFPVSEHSDLDLQRLQQAQMLMSAMPTKRKQQPKTVFREEKEKDKGKAGTGSKPSSLSVGAPPSFTSSALDQLAGDVPFEELIGAYLSRVERKEAALRSHRKKVRYQVNVCPSMCDQQELNEAAKPGLSSRREKEEQEAQRMLNDVLLRSQVKTPEPSSLFRPEPPKKETKRAAQMSTGESKGYHPTELVVPVNGHFYFEMRPAASPERGPLSGGNSEMIASQKRIYPSSPRKEQRPELDFIGIASLVSQKQSEVDERSVPLALMQKPYNSPLRSSDRLTKHEEKGKEPPQKETTKDNNRPSTPTGKICHLTESFGRSLEPQPAAVDPSVEPSDTGNRRPATARNAATSRHSQAILQRQWAPAGNGMTNSASLQPNGAKVGAAVGKPPLKQLVSMVTRELGYSLPSGVVSSTTDESKGGFLLAELDKSPAVSTGTSLAGSSPGRSAVHQGQNENSNKRPAAVVVPNEGQQQRRVQSAAPLWQPSKLVQQHRVTNAQRSQHEKELHQRAKESFQWT